MYQFIFWIVMSADVSAFQHHLQNKYFSSKLFIHHIL